MYGSSTVMGMTWTSLFQSTNNAIGANKRPSTSLAPVLAFEPDNLCAPHVAASSSGSRASVSVCSHVMHAVLHRDVSIGAASLEGRVFATASVDQPDVDPPEETYEGESKSVVFFSRRRFS